MIVLVVFPTPPFWFTTAKILPCCSERRARFAGRRSRARSATCPDGGTCAFLGGAAPRRRGALEARSRFAGSGGAALAREGAESVGSYEAASAASSGGKSSASTRWTSCRFFSEGSTSILVDKCPERARHILRSRARQNKDSRACTATRSCSVVRGPPPARRARRNFTEPTIEAGRSPTRGSRSGRCVAATA